jgi:hypothetical protein
MIDKVMKLMSLAEGTSFSAEAEAARSAAISLMAKHNIEYSEMNSSEDEFVIEIDDSNRKRKATEESTLINAIARFSGVAMITNDSGPTVIYKFVGTKNDIDAFRYTLSIVHNQRDVAWKASGKRGSNNQYHFRMGYALGVASKVYQLMNDMEKRVEEWGLVPRTPAAAASDWYKEQHKVRQARQVTASKYDRGAFVAGQNVSLVKGLNSSTLSISR